MGFILQKMAIFQFSSHFSVQIISQNTFIHKQYALCPVLFGIFPNQLFFCWVCCKTKYMDSPGTDCCCLQNRSSSLACGKWHCIEVIGLYFALITWAGLTARPNWWMQGKRNTSSEEGKCWKVLLLTVWKETTEFCTWTISFSLIGIRLSTSVMC